MIVLGGFFFGSGLLMAWKGTKEATALLTWAALRLSTLLVYVFQQGCHGMTRAFKVCKALGYRVSIRVGQFMYKNTEWMWNYGFEVVPETG